MDLSYIQVLVPSLMRGLQQTLALFLMTLAFALPLGLPLALGSGLGAAAWKRVRSGWSSRNIWSVLGGLITLLVKAVTRLYIWVFRGTPLMLQLYFFCYGLPSLGIVIADRFTVAVITFALNYAAYFAEIYRAGIESIDRGQHEAAKSLGFSPWQTMRMIIIPQTIKRILPPVANETITLIKDTALVTAIGVAELLKAAKDAANRDVRPDAFFAVAIIYLVLTAVLTLILSKIEKRFSRHEKEDD